MILLLHIRNGVAQSDGCKMVKTHAEKYVYGVCSVRLKRVHVSNIRVQII